MRKTNVKRIYCLLPILLLFLVSTDVFPQGPPPPPPGLPIDGGVLFLLISGIVYAVKKIKE